MCSLHSRGPTAMPKRVHVTELLGSNAWLCSSEDSSQHIACVTHSCLLVMVQNFDIATTASAVNKNRKGKCWVWQIFTVNFPVLHLFCKQYPATFHAVSFTKPFPSLGLGNWLWWQSNLFSPRCHAKWAQWEDVEGNCLWSREWQISDGELNKSAQVLRKIPDWVCTRGASMLGDTLVQAERSREGI